MSGSEPAATQDVTSLFTTFREAARHLWNTAFQNADFGPGHDWDRRDAFSRVATELFTALVLEPLGAGGQRLPDMWEYQPAPLTGFTVTPAAQPGVPIMINRASPPSPYWDHPIERIAPGEGSMRFVRFFDWDELGLRDFAYVEVELAEFPAHPDLVGRRALVEFGYVRIYCIDAGEASGTLPT